MCACSAALYCFHWRSHPILPYSWSVAVWVTVAATAAPFNRHICSAAPLRHPAAQRVTHHIYRLLSLQSCVVPLPLAPLVHPDSLAECTSLLTFFQWGTGTLVPLMAQALDEARLFQYHQWQRLQVQKEVLPAANLWGPVG